MNKISAIKLQINSLNQIIPQQNLSINNTCRKQKLDWIKKEKLRNSNCRQSQTVPKNLNLKTYQVTPKINRNEKSKIREILKQKNQFKHGILTLQIDNNKFVLSNKQLAKKNRLIDPLETKIKILDPIKPKPINQPNQKKNEMTHLKPRQKIISQIQTETKILNVNQKYFRINKTKSKFNDSNKLIQRYYNESHLTNKTQQKQQLRANGNQNQQSKQQIDAQNKKQLNGTTAITIQQLPLEISQGKDLSIKKKENQQQKMILTKKKEEQKFNIPNQQQDFLDLIMEDFLNQFDTAGIDPERLFKKQYYEFIQQDEVIQVKNQQNNEITEKKEENLISL